MQTSKSINLTSLYHTLINNFLIIAGTSIFFAATFYFYSTSIENKYQSKAVLFLNEVDKVSKRSSFGDISSLASLAGLGGLASDERVSLAIEVSKSRDFFNLMIQDLEIRSVLESNVLHIPAIDEKFEIMYRNYIQDLFKIRQNRDSGFIEVSVTHPDPSFSKVLLEKIILNLNDLVKTKELADSQAALEYYSAQRSKLQNNDLKNSLNNLIEEQLQKQMLTNVRQDYLLRYIDYPYVPVYKFSPRRAYYLISGFLFGFLLSILFALMREQKK